MTDNASDGRSLMKVAEWVRQALGRARRKRPETVEAKLAAVAEAASHEHPTADVDVMLREIEADRCPAWSADGPPGGSVNSC